MIIILEGPDGSGKTTLARDLQQRYGLSYHHEGPPPKKLDIVEHLGSVLDGFRTSNVVIDRWALGERVYGPIYRGYDSLGADGWRLMQRLVRATGALQVMCLPSYEICHRAWSSGREEMLKKEEQFKFTYEKYIELKGNQYIYDYTNDLNVEHLYKIIDTLLKLEKEVGGRSLPPHYVGAGMPTRLFVGEKGANPNAKHDLAFFSTYGSSAYLNNAIEAAGFDEGKIAFVNAHRHDNAPNDLSLPVKFWHTGDFATIALGNKASAELIRQNISHYKLPHPQFWKRFYSSRFQEYVDMLRSCNDGSRKLDFQ